MQTPTNPKGEKRKGFLEKLHALYNKEAPNGAFDSWVLRELLYQQVQTNELLRQQVSELQKQNAELKQQNLRLGQINETLVEQIHLGMGGDYTMSGIAKDLHNKHKKELDDFAQEQSK